MEDKFHTCLIVLKFRTELILRVEWFMGVSHIHLLKWLSMVSTLLVITTLSLLVAKMDDLSITLKQATICKRKIKEIFHQEYKSQL